MVPLKHRIKNGLDEARMLMLGAQVLLGFQYRSLFEKGFEQLPVATQYLKVVALGLMLVAVGLMMAPSAYHRIVDEGENTPDLPPFIFRMMAVALLPFAFGMGIDLFVATEKLSGVAPGVTAGLTALFVALFFWYFMGISHRREWHAPRMEGGGILVSRGEAMEKDGESQKSDESQLRDKIDHALTEARVVLPGAQALLGFQFATMLVEGFEKLPLTSKYLHLASLALIALSTILLMTPAAYHRIAEQGEYTEHFHRLTGRLLVAAMVPLALGITGDFYVVVRKVFQSAPLSLGLAILMLLFFYGLWFGYTLYHRSRFTQQPRLLAAGRAAPQSPQ